MPYKKQCHTCPKCGKKWRCVEAEKCDVWKKTNCSCSHCDGFTCKHPACQEAKPIWSVS